MNENPLFILEGNGPIENRGCEAILRSTVSILRKEFGPCRFIDIPGNPEGLNHYVEKDPDIEHIVHQSRRVQRFTPHWWYLQIRKSLLGSGANDAIYSYVPQSIATFTIGGDNYSLDYGNPQRRFARSQATLRRRKPLILWGGSVGPFHANPKFEKFASKKLREFTLICARESETVQYLKNIGVERNVQEVSDPAFLLEPQSVELAESERVILETPCIGINISPMAGWFWKGKNSWETYITNCIKAVLDASPLPVVLVPHVMCRGNNDHEFLRQTTQRLSEYSRRMILLSPNYNAQELKWIISHLSIFAGARTHSTIASLSSCIPTISIGYSMKARGINQDIFGHQNWLIHVKDLTPKRFSDAICCLYKEREQVHEHLTRIMPDYKARAQKAAEYVREIIDNNN